MIGSVADGWWRDRPGAVRRLLARLQCHAERTGATLVLVLDVPQADLPEGDHEGVTIRYPARRGRNAADERIVELVQPGMAVVTSDRALADQARERGATVVGARSFLSQVETTGC